MANLKDIAAGTMIGFSANKTEDQAKADTSTNRVDICKTKQLYLNGERVGLSDAEAGYLTKKVQEEYNARMSVSVSLSRNVLEKGAQDTVLINVHVKWDGALVDPGKSNITCNIGGTVIELTKSGSAYTGSTTQTNSFSVSVSATYNGITKTASASASAYYKFYVGQSTASSITSLPSSGFTAKGPQASAAGTYPFTFANGEYAYFLLPEGVSRGKFASAGADGLYHAVEGVSDVPFIKQSTPASIGGASYDVFRLANAQAASSHSITI